MAEQSVNIPQVIVFLVLTFLAIRWFYKPATTGTRAAPSQSASRVNPSHIDQIAHMFPQLSRRDIAWDLQRNGGNAAATTERMLSGRGLDPAPPSFTLPTPPQPRRAQPVAAAKPAQPDLITRYNLSSKLGKEAEPAAQEQPKPKAWSQDRNERQMNLQRRREEMILAARRKLEKQEKSKATS
ncbi:AMFR protein-like protein [Phaeosphaeriaceae sp. PMI808]|nr:AMFR protein-like protein [Phaeosphaeriaceae sp. PMI808]